MKKDSIQMDELGFLLKIAKSAAIKAGRFLYQNIGVEQTILLNEGRDIKLQLDTDAEEIIKNYLVERSKYAILGEESGLSQDLGEFYWVVDPLDGTFKFFEGNSNKLRFNFLNAKSSSYFGCYI